MLGLLGITIRINDRYNSCTSIAHFSFIESTLLLWITLQVRSCVIFLSSRMQHIKFTRTGYCVAWRGKLYLSWWSSLCVLEALNFPSSKQISFSMNDCQKFVIPTIEDLFIVAANVCCPHSVVFYVILKQTILIHVFNWLLKFLKILLTWIMMGLWNILHMLGMAIKNPYSQMHICRDIFRSICITRL